MAEQLLTAFKVAGTVFSVVSEVTAGQRQADILARTAEVNAQGQEARAAALARAAGAERAAGQRAAREQRRRGEIARSRAIALAGASGAGVSDPSVIQNLGTLAGNTEFEALTALFEGESSALGLEDEARLVSHGAEALRYQGLSEASAARTRGLNKGIANALTGGVSLYEHFSDIAPARAVVAYP